MRRKSGRAWCALKGVGRTFPCSCAVLQGTPEQRGEDGVRHQLRELGRGAGCALCLDCWPAIAGACLGDLLDKMDFRQTSFDFRSFGLPS